MKTPIIDMLFAGLLFCLFSGSLLAEVAPNPIPLPAPDLEKTKQLVENSTVTVEFTEADRACGATGFVIEQNGKKYVATNIHVFAGQAITEADSLWTEGPPTLQMGTRDASKSRIKSSFRQFLDFARGSQLPKFKGRDGSAIVAKPNILMSSAGKGEIPRL